MNKKNKGLAPCFWFCLLLPALAFGQYKTESSGLELGQQVPDLTFEHILGAKEKKVSMKELSGKLVILDFWNIWCSTCIAAMPEMNALQEQFGDQIKIFLVTKNKKADVERTLARAKVSISALDVITDDTLLNTLFPHLGEPHHVWIDGQGRFQYNTFGHNTTVANIDAFLQGQKLQLAQKDRQNRYDRNRTLLEQSQGDLAPFVADYAVRMMGMATVTPERSLVIKKDSLKQWPYYFRAVNVTPYILAQAIYNDEVYGFEVGTFNLKRNNRVLLELSHPEDLFEPSDSAKIDAWNKKNRISFEAQVDPKNAMALYQFMQQHLQNSYPFQVHIEKRKVKCLVLSRKPDADISALISTAKTEYVGMDQGLFRLRGASLDLLVRQLIYSNSSLQMPIINDTGIRERIDLNLELPLLANLEKLKVRLHEFGLDLIEKDKWIKMLVIGDR